MSSTWWDHAIRGVITTCNEISVLGPSDEDRGSGEVLVFEQTWFWTQSQFWVVFFLFCFFWFWFWFWFLVFLPLWILRVLSLNAIFYHNLHQLSNIIIKQCFFHLQLLSEKPQNYKREKNCAKFHGVHWYWSKRSQQATLQAWAQASLRPW